MKYYSTNHTALEASLEKAVIKGLAEDRGLYMPSRLEKLSPTFFEQIEDLSFQEIAYNIANVFFGEDVAPEALKKIVYDTLSFDTPLKKIDRNI